MRAWYLVHTKPAREKSAQQHLERQGYETYLPLVEAGLRRQDGARKRRSSALFPRYLFVHLDNEGDNWSPIRSTVGVSALVRFGANAASVPDGLIDALKNREQADGTLEMEEPAISPGAKVRIVDGAMHGYEAVFKTVSGKDRVQLLLHIAGGIARLELSRGLIEPV